MSTSRTARRPHQREWEARKDRVIELYLSVGLKLTGPNGVIDTMAREGFTATKAQYESQFRKWGVRKNMKRQEYVRIIEEQQQEGRPVLITLNGRAVSDVRSKRALRRYATKAERSALRNIDDATREISEFPMLTGDRNTPAEHMASVTITPTIQRDDNGIDNLATFIDIGPVNQNNGRLLAEPGLEVIDMPFNDNLGAPAFYVDVENAMDIVNFNLPSAGSHGYSPSCFPSGRFSEQNIGFEKLSRHKTLSPGLPGTSFDKDIQWLQDSNLASIEYLGLPSSPHSYRQLLPTEQWRPPSVEITGLLVKGIIRNAEPTTPTHNTVLNIAHLTNNLVYDIRRSCIQHDPNRLTLAPKKLLSTETFFGEESLKLPSDATLDLVTEARLCGRLITSIINGFPDFEDVPPAGILRFLDRYRATTRSITQLLRSEPSPMIKSLAENIFRAALEKDDVNIIKFLLDHGNLVHVDDTVCLHRGERYTPLEIAAMNQSLGVIEFLTGRDVKVNKSFPRLCRSGMLDSPLENEKRSTVDDRILCLVDRLLSSGATISVGLIRSHLRSSVDQRLIVRLIENSTSKIAREIVSDIHFLEEISSNISESDAEKSIKLLTDRCDEKGALYCSYQYLLCEAVKHRYRELVKILLPYASSLSELLRKARRVGDEEIINIILKRFSASHDETNETEDVYISEVEEVTDVDTLINALQSGDQNTVLVLGRQELLSRLERSELIRVFEVAVKEGDLQLANRVLEIDPDLYFAREWNSDRKVSCMEAAVVHGLDDIVWELAALVVGEEHYLPLKTMVLMKHDLLMAMVKSGRVDLSRVLVVAIERSDESLIQEIREAQSGTLYPSPTLLERAAENECMDLYWDAFDAWLAENPAGYYEWPDLLDIAIQRKDTGLLDKLLTRGARVGDDSLLRTTLKDHPSMIRPLLEQYQRAHPQGRVGYGRYFVEEAITSVNRDWIELCFEFNLIAPNIRAMERRETLLMHAISFIRNFKDDDNVITRLIDAGSDVNALGRYDSFWKTPLLLAIQRENVEIVQILIQRGAGVNKEARRGIWRTPLQQAAEVNNSEIVNLLLEHGADVNAEPALLLGATALQFASINGNCHIAMMLLKHGARLDVRPPRGPNGRWPLEGAAENGRFDMIQLLWDVNGGPFDDKQCQRAMRLAERNGYLGCRDLIKDLMGKSQKGF